MNVRVCVRVRVRVRVRVMTVRQGVCQKCNYGVVDCKTDTERRAKRQKARTREARSKYPVYSPSVRSDNGTLITWLPQVGKLSGEKILQGQGNVREFYSRSGKLTFSVKKSEVKLKL